MGVSDDCDGGFIAYHETPNIFCHASKSIRVLGVVGDLSQSFRMTGIIKGNEVEAMTEQRGRELAYIEDV